MTFECDHGIQSSNPFVHHYGGVRPDGSLVGPCYVGVARPTDLSYRCPACGWSTWNREVEQHICPEPTDQESSC